MLLGTGVTFLSLLPSCEMGIHITQFRPKSRMELLHAYMENNANGEVNRLLGIIGKYDS
jgi:hypothetical protein